LAINSYAYPCRTQELNSWSPEFRGSVTLPSP